MSRQHSIVPHRPNYFFIPLEDDYLAMYAEIDDFMLPYYEEHEIKPGPIDCKAMIASVLEAWMNSKRPTAKTMDDLFTYFTYDEWEQALRYRYKRSTIIQCLKEMEIGIQFMDVEGKYGPPMTEYTGTIVKRHFVQNTYEYRLNLPCVLEALAKLPEQSPFDQKPKPALGRPRKNRLKINDINKNGLISDDSRPKTDDGSVKTNDSRPKINAPFYTQITETTQTDTEEGAFAQTPPLPDNLIPAATFEARKSESDARLKAVTPSGKHPVVDVNATFASQGIDPEETVRHPAIRVNVKPQGDNNHAAVHDAGNSDAGAGGSLPGHTDADRVPAHPDAAAHLAAAHAAHGDTRSDRLAVPAAAPAAAKEPPDTSLDACSGPLFAGHDGAAPLAGVGTSPPFASASQPRASGANASNMEANATVYTMATVAPPLSVRDELPRPLSPKQERARYEAHVWQLIEDVRKERGLRPSTYGKAWKALRENQEGINALYADAVSDEDITRGYKAMLDSSDAWLRANFTMMAFFKRLQGLLDAKPATTSTTGKGKPSRTAYDGQTDLDIYGFGQNDEAQIAKFTKLGAAS